MTEEKPNNKKEHYGFPPEIGMEYRRHTTDGSYTVQVTDYNYGTVEAEVTESLDRLTEEGMEVVADEEYFDEYYEKIR